MKPLNNNPIGVIDSGLGGLSIASVIIKKLPHESIIYVADSKNCPYGQRTPDKIYKLSKKMIDFLMKKDIKLLVIACNTITVTCLAKLRKDYPNIPIVGIVPVVKTAVDRSKKGKIGIFSTVVTAKSEYQKNLIEEFAKGVDVKNEGSSDMVAMIENLDFEAIRKALNAELKVFKDSDIDVLALGCSHFPLIKDRFQKNLPGVLVLDSSQAVARQVKRILMRNKINSNAKSPKYDYYSTGNLKAMHYFINKLTINKKVEKILLQ